MSYIDRNLIPNEEIIFRTKKHLIIFLLPVLLLIGTIYISAYMENNPILVKVYWGPWIVTAIIWAIVGLEYMSSEFAVTNKRVMMREGFFTRHSNEIRLNAISQINVDQTILGQLLNYGIVSINAFGAYDQFSLIAKPFMFQRYVNEQIDRRA